MGIKRKISLYIPREEISFWKWRRGKYHILGKYSPLSACSRSIYLYPNDFAGTRIQAIFYDSGLKYGNVPIRILSTKTHFFLQDKVFLSIMFQDPNLQHVYFALTGLLLGAWVIGPGVVHSLYTIFFTYLVLLLGRSIKHFMNE